MQKEKKNKKLKNTEKKHKKVKTQFPNYMIIFGQRHIMCMYMCMYILQRGSLPGSLAHLHFSLLLLLLLSLH